MGLSKSKWIKDENIWRYYSPLHEYKILVQQIINRAEEVKKWLETKYTYTIPKYKLNETINRS